MSKPKLPTNFLLLAQISLLLSTPGAMAEDSGLSKTIAQVPSNPLAQAVKAQPFSLPGATAPKPNSKSVPITGVLSTADFSSSTLSDEATELAEILKLTPKLRQLERMRADLANQEKANAELKEQFRDLKDDIRDCIEQTRLEIEYVRAELFTEEAIHMELIEAFTQERDNRVYKSNIWSVRTNGALWAVSEALSIPSYKQPRFSIPAGTTGILAGLVPSVFSALALRQSHGGAWDRQARPNMLAKIFNYPVRPQVDYPPAIWDYLQTIPQKNNPENRSRINLLIYQWIEDKNIRLFSGTSSKKDMDTLTGNGPQRLSLTLLANRGAMLTELDALIALMNRPLLELEMAMRGRKHLQ